MVPEDRLPDVACGSGEFSRFCAKNVKCVYGVDISERMIEIAENQDIAPGYDHIVTAIGGAISSSCGADFLCYVTPAEHLALPNVEDVYEGVMASRIAAHVGDMIKYGDRARGWDLDMARARRDLDWGRQ